MVKKSRAVKKEKGLLGQCDKSKGKATAMKLRQDIIRFCENHGNSQMGLREKDRPGYAAKVLAPKIMVDSFPFLTHDLMTCCVLQNLRHA